MQPYSFLVRFESWQITVFVLMGMVLLYWAGHLISKRMRKDGLGGGDKTSGVVEGSMLGLLALLLGFSFSLSNSRYDKRQQLVIDEANAIGTAVLRVDLYPDSIRIPLKAAMKDYLEARISYNDAGGNRDAIIAAVAATERCQQKVWGIVTAAAQHPEHVVRTNQMVPALNETFDLASTRLAYLLARVPDLIFFMLFTLCLTGSFLIGYADEKKPEWGVVTSFLIMVGLSIFMIMDLDRPRSGIINNKAIFQQITALRSMFTTP